MSGNFKKLNVPLAIWFYLGNFCKLYTHKNAPTSWHHGNFISVTHPKVPAATVQGSTQLWCAVEALSFSGSVFGEGLGMEVTPEGL